MTAAVEKKKGLAKTRIPIALAPAERLAKPEWIRVRAPSPGSRFHEIKQILRENNLHTVCEEASCPNIGECFGKGTATFMILGTCARGAAPSATSPTDGRWRPIRKSRNTSRRRSPPSASPTSSITSVDRDDLKDGGARHFVDCIRAVRERSPRTKIEILVPDFRGRLERALEALEAALPDVMNHNLETVPRLYRQARPGGNYPHSLKLLADFKAPHPHLPTKSGLMVGLGETDDEILQVMRDLRAHGVDMLTIGQYLQPSAHHLPVARYAHPEVFAMFEREAQALGFTHAAVGAMVRSSYHADRQAHAAGVN